jgi:predicted Mrr-cat superfamily restriction endonuclease
MLSSTTILSFQLINTVDLSTTMQIGKMGIFRLVRWASSASSRSDIQENAHIHFKKSTSIIHVDTQNAAGNYDELMVLDIA